MIKENDPLKNAHQISSIIGGAFVGAVLCYVVVVQFIKPPAPASSATAIRPVFFLIAAFILPMAYVMKKFLLRRLHQDSLEDLIKRLQTAQLATFALCETPAIYGLILYLTGHPVMDFYLMAGYALFCIALHFPRFSRWQEFTAGAPAA